MLEMRPECERCARHLPGDADGALICSFECTFCMTCNESALKNICPNCSGELLPRPKRTAKTHIET